MCNKKRLAKVWEPSDPRRTEPYPDQAGLRIRGDGSGFNNMRRLYLNFRSVRWINFDVPLMLTGQYAWNFKPYPLSIVDGIVLTEYVRSQVLLLAKHHLGGVLDSTI